MSFNPSAEGFDFSSIDSSLEYKTDRLLKESSRGYTVLATKFNDDKKVVIQCIQNDLEEKVVKEYISRFKWCISYSSADCIKYYPTYKTLLTITPHHEMSLSNIDPMTYLSGVNSRNKLFLDILYKLKYLQEDDLLHGDLKPSNIFISSKGEWMVKDFWKYKLFPQTFPSDDLSDHLYYSPEMINGKEITIKSDVWSLGCIIYYCCTGQSPFFSDSIESIHDNINSIKYKPLTGIFDVYNYIISKIFVIDPNSRLSVSNLSWCIKRMEIYYVKNDDFDILTDIDFDRMWIEIVYCQWCNDKETMMKYLGYIRSINNKGNAFSEFMDRFINNIEYLPLLWDIVEDFVNEYYMRSEKSCKIEMYSIDILPSKFNTLKNKHCHSSKPKIIGNKVLIEKDYHRSSYGNYNIYEEVELIDEIPVDKKRITFSEEIIDIDPQILNPAELYSIFFSKYSERSKDLTFPLHYLPQYVISSKYIHIYPTESGFYTSISITPKLPKGLKLDKITGRIYGKHRIVDYFSERFTVTAFINNREVSKSTFTLVIAKEKNEILIVKKSYSQHYLHFKYKCQSYSFKVHEEIKEITPTFSCENPKFSFISECPPGLKINENTGSISGKLSQYFGEYLLLVNMTNGYESVAKGIFISCEKNGEKNVEEWIIPIDNKKSKLIICEVNQPISIHIPNVNSLKDKKNLIIQPTLPKDILELNFHNCVIKGVSSKPLPKTHYVVKSKENNKVVYEFDLEVKSLFKFSYPEDRYGFKIGELVNIKPIIAIDDKDEDNDLFYFVVGCNKKLPNGLTLDKYSGSICGVASDYVWEDDYDILIQSNVGVKSISLSLFTGEKPKSFKYEDNVMHCFEGEVVSFVAIFEGRCCEFRVFEGELPYGLVINTWNGLLSGITYYPGEYKFTVRCENMLGYIDEEVTIEVSSIQPSVIQYEKNLYEYVINKPIDPIIPKMKSEGHYSFIVYTNNLPSGLSIDNKTGVISGTPTEICKCEKVNKMQNKKGEEIEYGTKVGRNVLIAYKERSSYYTSISLYFHIGKPPQICKYGEKNEFIVFRSRNFVINPTYDDCECNFYIVNGSLPSGIIIDGLNGSIYGRTYDAINTYEITVRCKNSFGFVDVKLKLDIHEYIVKGLKYENKCYYLLQNEVIEEIKPLAIPCDGKCDVEKTKLPAGLSINEEGIITGSPTTLCDKSDFMIYWNGVRNTIFTSLRINVGIKPNFVLEYQNNGKFKCGCNKEFHYSLLNDQNEIAKLKGYFTIEPGIILTSMRINPQTGEISGQGHSENEENHYTIVFDNHFGKVSTEIEITTGYPPNPILYSQPYYSFDLNTPISITSLEYGGNNLIFSINPPLPEGVTIRSDCGMISGKATSKPYYQKHKVTVSNDYGSCETELLLYFGNPDYFVYYDDIEYYESIDSDIVIKPKICGKKCNIVVIPNLPDGLKMTDNCEIVGKTKETMILTKYTIIQKNECEYTTHILLEIGEKPKPVVYEKNEYEINVTERFSIKPKEKNKGCRYTVEPEFPDGVQIHPIKGVIYGEPISSLLKTNYTITCTNKYGSVKTNISLTITKN